MDTDKLAVFIGATGDGLLFKAARRIGLLLVAQDAAAGALKLRVVLAALGDAAWPHHRVEAAA